MPRNGALGVTVRPRSRRAYVSVNIGQGNAPLTTVEVTVEELIDALG